ncbi:YciI family protein [Luteitalea sp.]|jgi:hypothetical protein
MARYLLLLRDADTFPDMSPEAMQAVLQRYIDWTHGLASRGLLVDASKLQDRTGRVLRPGSGGLSVTDGPFVEGKEIIGGYYVVSADSWDDAVNLASDCPHLELGSIEIRELEQTGDEQS